MASTTTNLGLTKPAYADEADIAVLNGNMDLLDAAYGSINQSTMRPVPFAIAVGDWTAITGGFSATYNTAYITETSQEILTYTKSLADYAKAHIDAEKKSGGGGIVFTTATKPTGTIQGTAYVFDNDDRTLPVIIEGTVTPITNGGTGQSSLAGAQSALGITALSEQIENLHQAVFPNWNGMNQTWDGQSFHDIVTLTPGKWLLVANYVTTAGVGGIICRYSSYGTNNYYGDVDDHGGTVYIDVSANTTIQIYVNTNDTGSYTFYRPQFRALKLK